MTGWGRSIRGRAPRDAADARVEALVEAHAADVLAYLQRRTESAEDAADVLSDTLTVVWRRIEDLPQDDERARMWMFATARNALANHRRGRRRAGDLAGRLREELAAQRRSAGADAHDQVADAVREAIGRLPAAQRELVTLVHWEGFSLAGAAEVVGIPASTARGRYAAARAELTRWLADGPLSRPPTATPRRVVTAEPEHRPAAPVGPPGGRAADGAAAGLPATGRVGDLAGDPR